MMGASPRRPKLGPTDHPAHIGAHSHAYLPAACQPTYLRIHLPVYLSFLFLTYLPAYLLDLILTYYLPTDLLTYLT